MYEGKAVQEYNDSTLTYLNALYAFTLKFMERRPVVRLAGAGAIG